MNEIKKAPASLQREIEQSKPFESLEVEVYLNLMRSYALLSQEHDRYLKQKGLTPVTYNILRILRGAGDAGTTCSDVARRLLTRVPDVTRLVDRLVVLGLVARRRTERDRRLVMLTLSDAGATILTDIDAPLRVIIEGNLTHMPPDKLDALNRLLVEARCTVVETT